EPVLLYPGRPDPYSGEPRRHRFAADRGAVRVLSGRRRYRALRGPLRSRRKGCRRHPSGDPPQMSDRASTTTPSPARSLGSIAARGAILTMGGQGVKIMLQFCGIVILARLLSPNDYGLMAMVVV